MLNSFGGTSAPSSKARSLDFSNPRKTFNTNEGPLTFHALGKSYGDVALNKDGTVLLTTAGEHLLRLDLENSLVRVQSGITLRALAQILRQYQLALPVTPGTQLISVAGAIANDIHGKSHHIYGSFGNQLSGLRLLRIDGSDLWCSASENSELFAATIGGLGLTGLILEAELKLVPYRGSFVQAENLAFANIPEFFRLNREHGNRFEASVSWVDCGSKKFGRGIFSGGNFAGADFDKPLRQKPALTLPKYSGPSLVNRVSVSAFNQLYFAKERRSKSGRIPKSKFFYPLDGINNWNRIYGGKGFYQYQSVIPTAMAEAATIEMMQIIKASKEASFLTVLKLFGEIAPLGMLSFPMPGLTLAVDFPERGAKTRRLFADLDRVVSAAGGRLYFAKDARMSAEMAERGYPALAEFKKYRDPGVTSDLAKRLLGA